MTQTCRACGQSNEADAQHCDQCGEHLNKRSSEVPSASRKGVLIGVSEGCALRLNDPEISSHHALVVSEDGAARIFDLGSTNGTSVNGTKLYPGGTGARVLHNSKVQCGPVLLAGAHILSALSRGSRALVVGRDPTCDFAMDLPQVSTRHLVAMETPQGFDVIDLFSSNGTGVRQALSTETLSIDGVMAVKLDDVLYLGSARLPVQQIGQQLGEDAKHTGSRTESLKEEGTTVDDTAPGQYLPLGNEVVILGRDSACEVVIPSPLVSSRHVKLTPQGGGGFLVEDLGSLNGTFFEGRRIHRETIPAQATLTLGSYPIVLDGDRGVLQLGRLRGALRLDALKLSRIVKDRETGSPLSLVDEVSVSIYPSELVGLMGPSGAGKTTLMLALNGYEPPSSGQVLINGDDLYTHFDQYRGLIGYVPQDDILHGELTVEEALSYAARLRLPPDTTSKEIAANVDRVLTELNLQAQRHLLIGSAESKVLSGGQRKRVNLAMELVTDPVLLFLDEPTSGLSARDTSDVMDVLRGLADSGRTLVITIHQPSRSVYERMDHVIHMAPGGRLAFFGPTAPDSYRYFNLKEPSADAILDRLKDDRSPDEWQARYRQSEIHKTYVTKRQSQAPDREALRSEVERRSVPVPRFRQWWTLFRRYTRIKFRDRTNLIFMLAQAPLVGLLLAMAFHDAVDEPMKRGTPIFILCVAIVFFGCMNACREIVTERIIFRRERMVNLKLGPYLMSKFIFLASVGILQSALLLFLVHKFVGVEGDLKAYFGLLSLMSLASTALGLWISSLVKSAEAAMAVVPIVLIFQIVLSGFLIPLKAENKEYIEVFAAPMISRWSVEALLDIERQGLESELDQEKWKLKLMTSKDLSPKRVPMDAMVLLAFTGGYLFLARRRLRKEGPVDS